MESDGYDSDDNCYYDDTYSQGEDAPLSPNEPDQPSTSQSLEKTYTILTEDEIRQRQQEDISHISSVLSLLPQDASRLLCYYNWDVLHLLDQWFTNEKAVCDKVGLLTNSGSEIKTIDDNKKTQCGICFDDFDTENIRSLACGHPYCKTCWKSYIHTAIHDGPGCLFLRCPECKVAVTYDMVEALATKKYTEKYGMYFVRSYVEGKKEKIKWCPAPDCGHAIEFERGGDGNRYDVTCPCSHIFCWNCVDEPHRPVDCELVGKWLLKETSEAENSKWILAYSKPCPKCKRPIEKNRGCNHMTCSSPCKFQFCWLCLEEWSKHESFYMCNAYKGPELLEEKVRKDAKASLKRYIHYYERFAGNHKSRQKAIEDLHKFEKEDLNTLITMVNKPVTELEFVLEAWKQIIEARRVLKWSYAYGYYLLETQPAKKQFFEYLQGQAEGVLEKLHACAENVLSDFDSKQQQSSMIPSAETPDFGLYRSKLVSLTKVTGKHFEDLVRALENGLSEVDIVPNESTSSSQGRGVNNGANSDDEDEEDRAAYGENYASIWICDRCTCVNQISAASCQACYGGY